MVLDQRFRRLQPKPFATAGAERFSDPDIYDRTHADADTGRGPHALAIAYSCSFAHSNADAGTHTVGDRHANANVHALSFPKSNTDAYADPDATAHAIANANTGSDLAPGLFSESNQDAKANGKDRPQGGCELRWPD